MKDGIKLLEVQVEKITNDFPINMTWRLNFFLPKINLFRAATSTRLTADNPSLNTSLPYALATTSPSVSNGTTRPVLPNNNNGAPNWQAPNVPSGNAVTFPNAGYDQSYAPSTLQLPGNLQANPSPLQPRPWGVNTNNNGYAYSNNPSG